MELLLYNACRPSLNEFNLPAFVAYLEKHCDSKQLIKELTMYATEKQLFGEWLQTGKIVDGAQDFPNFIPVAGLLQDLLIEAHFDFLDKFIDYADALCQHNEGAKILATGMLKAKQKLDDLAGLAMGFLESLNEVFLPSTWFKDNGAKQA